MSRISKELRQIAKNNGAIPHGTRCISKDGLISAACEIEALEKQNAELLAALKFALECGEDGDWQSARRYLTEAIQPSTQEVSN